MSHDSSYHLQMTFKNNGTRASIIIEELGKGKIGRVGFGPHHRCSPFLYVAKVRDRELVLEYPSNAEYFVEETRPDGRKVHFLKCYFEFLDTLPPIDCIKPGFLTRSAKARECDHSLESASERCNLSQEPSAPTGGDPERLPHPPEAQARTTGSPLQRRSKRAATAESSTPEPERLDVCTSPPSGRGLLARRQLPDLEMISTVAIAELYAERRPEWIPIEVTSQ